MTQKTDHRNHGRGRPRRGRGAGSDAVRINMPDDTLENTAHHNRSADRSVAAMEDMMSRLLTRLDENDRRYHTALSDLDERLNHIASRAQQPQQSTNGSVSDTLDRLRDQASSLATQISDAGSYQQRHDHSREPMSDGFSNRDFSRTGFGDSRINSDFMDVSRRVERSLTDSAPASELAYISEKLDDLGRRLDDSLSQQGDAGTLQLIEQQLHALSDGVMEARNSHQRVSAIEGNLERLVHWAQSSHRETDNDQRLDAIEDALRALDDNARDMDDRTVQTLEAMNAALQSIANSGGLDASRGRNATRHDAPSKPLVERTPELQDSLDQDLESEVWIEEQADLPPDARSRRLEAELGASIPDYQPAPAKPGDMMPGQLDRHDGTETSHDFIESARRAAAAAAQQDTAPAPRSGLGERIANKFAAKRVNPDPLAEALTSKSTDTAKKPRRILYVLAAGLMLTSAGLMYARSTSHDAVKMPSAPAADSAPIERPAPVAPQVEQKSELPANPSPAPKIVPVPAEKHSDRMEPVTPTPASSPVETSDNVVTTEPATAPKEQATVPKPAVLQMDQPLSTASVLASLQPKQKDPMDDVTIDIKEPESRAGLKAPVPQTGPALVPAKPTFGQAPLAQPKRIPAASATNPRRADPLQKPAPVLTKNATGVRKDSKKATPVAMPPARIGPNSLRMAAARGNPAAQAEIGTRFAKGTGVPKNAKKAVEWFSRAAAQGHAPAQYRLGAMYERGQGVKQNVSLAKSWYRRAAEAGNIRAMHNLAVLYTRATNGQADYTSARNWFQKAAQYGVTDSQFNLGILYENGLSVRQNSAEAYKWFSIAARQGDTEARRRRDAIRAKLPSRSRKAAETIIRSWRPAQPLESANRSGPPRGGWNKAASSAPASTLDSRSIGHAQRLLNRLGYDAGTPDGKQGPQTTAAIRRFQSRVGLPQTGQITKDTWRRLNALAS